MWEEYGAFVLRRKTKSYAIWMWRTKGRNIFQAGNKTSWIVGTKLWCIDWWICCVGRVFCFFVPFVLFSFFLSLFVSLLLFSLSNVPLFFEFFRLCVLLPAVWIQSHWICLFLRACLFPFFPVCFLFLSFSLIPVCRVSHRFGFVARSLVDFCIFVQIGCPVRTFSLSPWHRLLSEPLDLWSRVAFCSLS